MDYMLLASSLTTAISIGMGCGTTCSPIATTFLTTYVISHSNGIKKSIASFASFFLGKILSVTFLCFIGSLISYRFINENGWIGNFNLRLTVQILMSVIGVYLLIQWFLENNKKSKCHKCNNCNKEISEKQKSTPIFLAGVIYGCTPCAPLILMIGYTFTLPTLFATITGFVFALTTIISPIILLMLITGVLSKKIREEIPYCLKWFRLASYILLIVMPFLLEIR